MKNHKYTFMLITTLAFFASAYGMEPGQPAPIPLTLQTKQTVSLNDLGNIEPPAKKSIPAPIAPTTPEPPKINDFEVDKTIITELNKSIDSMAYTIKQAKSDSGLEPMLSLKRTLKNALNSIEQKNITDFVDKIIETANFINPNNKTKILPDDIDKKAIAELKSYMHHQRKHLSSLAPQLDNWEEFRRAYTTINKRVPEFSMPNVSELAPIAPKNMPAQGIVSQKTAPITSPSVVPLHRVVQEQKLISSLSDQEQKQIKQSIDEEEAREYKQSIRDSIERLKNALYNWFFGSSKK